MITTISVFKERVAIETGIGTNQRSGPARNGQVHDLAGLDQPAGHLADLGLQQLVRQPHPLRIPLGTVQVKPYNPF